jgi:hypothetical protein
MCSGIVYLRVNTIVIRRRYFMERLFQGDLMAVVPVYNDGNCTEVYIKGMEPFILNRRTKNIISIICKHYMTDLKEVKKRYRKIVSSQNLVPIPLSRKDVFVPFKTRAPMYKNDGAFSYINMKHIKNISDKNDHTIVNLVDGNTIKCLCTLATVEGHMRNGYVVSRCYEDRAMRINEAPVFYNARIILSNDDINMFNE